MVLGSCAQNKDQPCFNCILVSPYCCLHPKMCTQEIIYNTLIRLAVLEAGQISILFSEHHCASSVNDTTNQRLKTVGVFYTLYAVNAFFVTDKRHLVYLVSSGHNLNFYFLKNEIYVYLINCCFSN